MRWRCGGGDTGYLDTYMLADDASRSWIGGLSFEDGFNFCRSHDCLTNAMPDPESIVRTGKLQTHTAG